MDMVMASCNELKFWSIEFPSWRCENGIDRYSNPIKVDFVSSIWSGSLKQGIKSNHYLTLLIWTFVISNSALFRTEILFCRPFQLLLFQTIFGFPSEFDTAVFNCNKEHLLKLESQIKWGQLHEQNQSSKRQTSNELPTLFILTLH